MAKVLALPRYDKKHFGLRAPCRKYTNSVNSVTLILATVTIRYALDNWSSGSYRRTNFEGGLFKSELD